MRTPARLVAVVSLFALTLWLTACGNGQGSSGTTGLTPDESPVPEGMPVMYEFYTES